MDLYKIEDELSYNFYMMPKGLFEGKYNKLSAEAKIAYMLIIDRLKLSKLNTWINESGELYLLYKREDLADMLGVCEKTIVKILKELKEFNLIKERRQGLGKPNLIFVSKIEEGQRCQNKNCKYYNSEIENNTILNLPNITNQEITKTTSQEITKTTSQEWKNLQGNNNKFNNNNYNNNSVSLYEDEMKELEKIKKKCELDYLLKTDEYRMKPIIENLLEIMYFSKKLKINNAILPQTLVREKMEKLNSGIVMYMIKKLNSLNEDEGNNIKNSTNFLISCLYNAITEYYSDSELMFKGEFC